MAMPSVLAENKSSSLKNKISLPSRTG